jgi:hypothetical protein
MMNNFKDFGIKPKVSNQFVGDKISLNRLVNVEIVVHDFKIEESKHKPGTQCLTMQIEKAGEKRVVFSGSKGLISQITQVPKQNFPFKTVISMNDKYCEFT